MKLRAKILWYGQAVFTLTYVIFLIWAGHYGYKLLVTSYSKWDAFFRIYLNAWFWYVLALFIFIGSIKRWPSAHILNVIGSYPRMKSFYGLILSYQETHVATFGAHGTIQISYGILDYINIIGAISGIMMLLFGLFLFIPYLYACLKARLTD